MDKVFHEIVSMSTTAAWLILALIALRPLLKKVPRWISCGLWALAAFRLICPFSFESAMSLIPRAQPLEPTLNRAAAVVLPAMNAAARVAAAETETAAAVPVSFSTVLSVSWMLGAALLAGYALVSYLRLKKRTNVSIRVGERLYSCDHIPTPFILGIVKPKIYIPSEMPENQLRFVLDHEHAHLRRRDNVWKPLAFAILCVHWFNPLCWAAYVLFCRDMELACDESVIRNLDVQGRKGYSAALLGCNAAGNKLSVFSPAFGEVSVRQRIRGVLHYRKPARWMASLAVVLCAVLVCCFLTNPVAAETTATLKEPTIDETTVPGNESITEGMTFLTDAELHIAPSAGSRIVTQCSAGDAVEVLRWERIADSVWAYVRSSDTIGWVEYPALMEKEAALEAAAAQNTDLSTAEPESGSTAQSLVFLTDAELHTAPSAGSRIVTQCSAGDTAEVLRWERIADSVWAYVSSGDAVGWVEYPALMEKDAALEAADTQNTDLSNEPTITISPMFSGALQYYYDYIAARQDSLPDRSEAFLYFESDAARENFRTTYIPDRVRFDMMGFQINDNLWSICGTRENDPAVFYDFVGYLNDRYYVFTDTKSIPNELTDGMDEKLYLEYIEKTYSPDGKAFGQSYESFQIMQQMMRYASPTRVETVGDMSGVNIQPHDYTLDDIFFSADTWHTVPVPEQQNLKTVIRLYSHDLSVAEFSPARDCVIVTALDGTQEAYAAYFQDNLLFDLIYGWTLNHQQ